MSHPSVCIIQPKAFHTWLPLGPAYLIAYAKKHCSLKEIRFLSQFHSDDETILKACEKADIIGISATTPQWNAASQLGTKIKKRNPKAWIVAGGYHATACPQESLIEPWLDAIVIGEGEKAFSDIVSGCRDRVVQRPPLSIDELNQLFPDREACQQKEQLNRSQTLFGAKMGELITTRGCAYSCHFCGSRLLWGKRPRMRSAASILEEIELLMDFGVDWIALADDGFGLCREKALDFCRLKEQSPFRNVPWACNLVAPLAIKGNSGPSQAFFDALKRAGCKSVWMGVESGSPKIMQQIGKPITLQNIRLAFKLSREAGLERRAYFLLGMPEETEKDIALTESLAEEIDPDIVGFSILCPYPGTKFYDPLKHQNVPWHLIDEYSNPLWSNQHLSNQRLRFHQNRLANKFLSKLAWHHKQIFEQTCLSTHSQEEMVAPAMASSNKR